MTTTDIFTSLNNLASKPLDADVQEQLGRIQSLINRANQEKLPKYYKDSLNIAISALTPNKPNLLLAQSILWDLEYYQMKSGYFLGKLLARLTGGWPMITAVVGMMAAGVIYGIPCIFVIGFKYYPSFMWSGGPQLATAMFFGILGGSVSILTRIRSPADFQKINPLSLFLNCLFKPLVGATFAAVTYSMIATGIILSIVTDRFTDNRDYLLVLFAAVVGFVAGFSERYAADAIGGVEASIGSQKGINAKRSGEAG
jgi:hypothetical protein